MSAPEAPAGPVFITGLGGSGKSLLGMLLAGHPALSIPRHETHFWDRFDGRYGDLGRPANFEACLRDLVAHIERQGFVHAADGIRRRFAVGDPTYPRLFQSLMEDHAEREGKVRWGAHAEFLDACHDRLAGAFPGACTLHMVRDPRDVWVERWRRRSRPGLAGALAVHWSASVRRAEARECAVPARYRIVRYEDLVGHPERTLEAVMRFVGVEPVPPADLIDALRRVRRKEGPIFFGELSPRHRGVYVTAGATREVAYLQARLGGALARHRYVSTAASPEGWERVRLLALDWPVNRVREMLTRAWLRLGQHARSRRSPGSGCEAGRPASPLVPRGDAETPVEPVPGRGAVGEASGLPVARPPEAPAQAPQPVGLAGKRHPEP